MVLTLAFLSRSFEYIKTSWIIKKLYQTFTISRVTISDIGSIVFRSVKKVK